MPFDIVGAIEGLFQVLNLLPSRYEAQYRRRAQECTAALAHALTEWLACPAAARDWQQYEKFKGGSKELAKLVSNPPAAGNLEHEELKGVLPCVLDTGQALRNRALTDQQAQEALAVLRHAVAALQART